MLVYHFLGETLRDGRPIPPVGEWLHHDGPVIPCLSGLHGSVEPFDALKYAPGGTLCLDELEGDLDDMVGDLKPHGNPIDKWVGRRRMILKRFDATKLLRRFACDQALKVVHLWPDIPEVVKDYLTTADYKLRLKTREALDAIAGKHNNPYKLIAWSIFWSSSQLNPWGAAWDTSIKGDYFLARSEFNSRVKEVFDTIK